MTLKALTTELGNSIAAGIAGGRTPYGWFVYPSEETRIDMPAELRRGCAVYVMFHRRPAGPELAGAAPGMIEPPTACAA